MQEGLFTSESVTPGHPDKICDIIADSVLDEILKFDKDARVACEVICTTGIVWVFGEISTKCCVDITKIVRRTLKSIGYTDVKFGLDYKNCAVIVNLDEQSTDIARGVNLENIVNQEGSLGAGDQGIVYGFACKDTESLMPAPCFYAQKLAKKLTDVRKEKVLPYLGPDGKTQVTVVYKDGEVAGIDAIVVSAQHLDGISLNQIKNDLKKYVIEQTIPENLMLEKTRIFINPTGRFVIGGPVADSGLTGRKIMVDTYGGFSRHGGGAFSGKDPTKVDRSGAYMARYVAKNIVAAGLAKCCEIQVAYVIGKSNPVSISVETFGSSKLSNCDLEKLVKKLFDFSPQAIIDKLDLLNPVYSQVACFGHFGRLDLNLSWEQLDSVELIKDFSNKI